MSFIVVSYLATHFALITISYLHYSVVTKIDILPDDDNKPINYYTVLKGEWGVTLWNKFYANSTSKKYLCEKYPDFCDDYYRYNKTWMNELIKNIIQLNMTDQFYNPYYFNYQTNYKPFNTENLVHRGYICKDTFSLKKVRKFWTYYLNKTIEKRLQVVFHTPDPAKGIMTKKGFEEGYIPND